MKYVSLVALLVAAGTVQAKSDFDQEKKRAVVTSTQDNKVYASYCEGVTQTEVESAQVAETLQSKKCASLTPNGLTLADVERNLPAFKESLLKAMGLIGETGKAMGKMMGDEKAGDFMGNLMGSALGILKAKIEGLTAQDLYDALDLDARDPSTEVIEKSDELDQQKNQFLLLSKP